MGAGIEHVTTFEHPVAQVLSAMASEEAVTERLATLGGKDAALVEHSADGRVISYLVQQGVSAEKLPRAAREFLAGDLIVHRQQTWHQIVHNGSTTAANGTARATVSGVPGEITASTELTEAACRTEYRVNGQANVRIPMVGGKLERTIAEQVMTLLDRESRFIAARLARE